MMMDELYQDVVPVTRVGCFAKVMEGSVWDTMSSDKINKESQQRIANVLEFMENDY